MNVLRKLASPLVFVLALTAAFGLSGLFAARPPVRPTAPPAVVEAAPPRPVGPAGVNFRTRLVTLDFAARQGHVTLELERAPAQPAPERLWVWAEFYSPRGGCAGETVELRRPFARGDRETFVVEMDASRCARPTADAPNYYARVSVSAESGPDALAAAEDSSLTATVPVVVQHARR